MTSPPPGLPPVFGGRIHACPGPFGQLFALELGESGHDVELGPPPLLVGPVSLVLPTVGYGHPSHTEGTEGAGRSLRLRPSRSAVLPGTS